MSKTIDLTPSWEAWVRTATLIMRDCEPKSKNEVYNELLPDFIKMAKFVDERKPDPKDVGMISAIITEHYFQEIYDFVPEGAMNAYEQIADWAIEFHNLYEGKVNWGEDNLEDYGFTESNCWDDAVLEFTRKKLKL